MTEFFRGLPENELSSLLGAIFENAIDGIININSKGVIEAVNPAAAHLFGYEADELLGKSINTLMGAPHAANHDGYIQRYLETGEGRIIGIGREVDGLRKDRSVFPFKLSVSEFQLGGKRHFTGVVHDISDYSRARKELEDLNTRLEVEVSERTDDLTNAVNRLLELNLKLEKEVNERVKAENRVRKREAEIREALQKEKELSELKSRFVSMASHEFRTPLSTILSSVNLIQRYITEEEQDKRERHIVKIKSAVQNLNGILNDFLSLSRLDEGKYKVDVRKVLWPEFYLNLLEDLKSLMKKGQQVVVQNQIKQSQLILDEKILTNIMNNLLSNAFKYSPEFSTITLWFRLEENWFHVEVEDHGIGIPKNEQRHLFSRFFRAENAENIEGTGLGLHIVKQYVSVLGGEINFTSEVDKGSKFNIRFPLESGA